MSLRNQCFLVMLATLVGFAVVGKLSRNIKESDVPKPNTRTQSSVLAADGSLWYSGSKILPTVFLPVQSKNPKGLGTGKLLVASRDLGDPHFAETVILLIQYDSQGVVGLILNRRTDIPLSRVLEGLKAAKDRSDSVYLGGPVEIQAVFALFQSPAQIEGAKHILAGEKDLFHDLIRPYERGAFLLAHSILRNQDDAEETVQQAMVKIFSHLAQLTESDKFKQWVMRVIENEAKMYRRKRRQHLYESLDQSSTEAADEKPFHPRQFADWRDLPSDAVEQKEVREAVAKALAALPDIYRAVFVLRDMQHLNVAETAEALDLGESAVKTRLHRARLMMRESLSPIFAKPKVSVWERWKGSNPWLAAKR